MIGFIVHIFNDLLLFFWAWHKKSFKQKIIIVPIKMQDAFIDFGSLFFIAFINKLLPI